MTLRNISFQNTKFKKRPESPLITRIPVWVLCNELKIILKVGLGVFLSTRHTFWLGVLPTIPKILYSGGCGWWECQTAIDRLSNVTCRREDDSVK